jgi:hypothetical protein
MELIRPCGHVNEPAFKEVGGYRPGFFARLLRLPIIKAELVPNVKLGVGNTTPTSQCSIDFHDSPCELHVKYHMDVAFGNELYRGITPISHVYGNVFNCTVEAIEIVRVEKGSNYVSHFYM